MPDESAEQILSWNLSRSRKDTLRFSIQIAISQLLSHQTMINTLSTQQATVGPSLGD